MLPHNGESSTVTMYAVVMVMCGLFKSWAAPACNNPIFAEVVPSHLRTLVYSFDRSVALDVHGCKLRQQKEAHMILSLGAERAMFGDQVVSLFSLSGGYF